MEKSKSKDENFAPKIAERIKYLLKQQKSSATALIAEANLNKNALYTMSKGYAPQVEAITRIADFLSCSVDFLLGRTENTEVNPSRSSEVVQGFILKPQTKKPQIKQKKYIRVQMPGKIAAGVGVFDDTASEAKIPVDYQDINSFGILEVVGDSMQPTLFQGDAVIFKRGTIPPTGRLVCVHFKESDDDDEGKYIIKELKRYSDSKYVFKSHNPNYEDKVIPASHIIGIGKVVYIAHNNR